MPRTKEKRRKQSPAAGGDWMQDPRFAPYWQHYFHAMGWYHKHMSVYYDSFKSPPFPDVPPSANPTSVETKGSATCTAASSLSYAESTSTKSQCASDIGRKPKGRKRHKRWRRRHYAEENETSKDESESEIRMEISEDMLNFFAVSENHRKQREAVKEMAGPAPNHVSAESCHKKLGSVEAPSERPGLCRSREIKLLYGDSAAMIHGMETALQMSYDRIDDVHRPKMWPNMPLRIIFA